MIDGYLVVDSDVAEKIASDEPITPIQLGDSFYRLPTMTAWFDNVVDAQAYATFINTTRATDSNDHFRQYAHVVPVHFLYERHKDLQEGFDVSS